MSEELAISATFPHLTVSLVKDGTIDLPTGMCATIFAASVDSIDKAREVAAGVSFPVDYGEMRETGDRLGS